MADTHGRKFTLASRPSALAKIQTNSLQAALSALYPDALDTDPNFETSFMTTAGDRNQSQALYLMGGKAFWTKDLEVALLEKRVDMLVHSLKDVPTVLPEGCILGAIIEREDPVDSLVVKAGEKWKSLDDLPAGSVVGTSSVRRVAQLKRNFPQLKFLDVVSTRFVSSPSKAHRQLQRGNLYVFYVVPHSIDLPCLPGTRG